MYVAGKNLTMPLGEIRRMGEPVPEALGWSHSVLRAHLDWGLIKKVEEPVDKVEVKSDDGSKKKKKNR